MVHLLTKYEVFYYDGSTLTQVGEGYGIQMYGDTLVWHHNASPQVFMYDGTSVTQFASGTLPDISGNNIVWQQSDGNDTEIYLYDGTSITQLTDNDYDDFKPPIDGDYITWLSNYGITDIYMATLSGGSTTAIPEPASIRISSFIEKKDKITIRLDVKILFFYGVALMMTL